MTRSARRAGPRTRSSAAARFPRQWAISRRACSLEVRDGWTIASRRPSPAIRSSSRTLRGRFAPCASPTAASLGSSTRTTRSTRRPRPGSGRVVFGCTDGAVYALDAQLGTLDWRFTTGGPIVACPRIDGDTVYIGSSDHIFRAIDLAEGEIIWANDGIGGFVETRPLLAGGRLVFGRLGRPPLRPRRQDRPDGLDLAGREDGPVLRARGLLARSGRRTRVHRRPGPDDDRHRAGHGTRRLWGTDNLTVRESIGISEDGKRVYVRTIENVIAAVSPDADGQETVWETDAGFSYDISSAQLVERDGIVFYGTKNGLLIALDAATGAVKWKHRVGVALLNTVTPDRAAGKRPSPTSTAASPSSSPTARMGSNLPFTHFCVKGRFDPSGDPLGPMGRLKVI